MVCDDASLDGTAAIVDAFAAGAPFPVRLLRNTTNVGPSKNFERAIAACAGELIALADQDDLWLPRKLERLCSAMKAPDVAYAFCDATLVDDAGLTLGARTLLARRFTLASIRDSFAAGDEVRLLLKRDFVYGTTLMFRAGVRDLVLPIPATWSHDSWIANVLACLGYRGAPVLEPLVLYRQHGSMTSGGFAAPRSESYRQRHAACLDLRARVVELSARDGRPVAAGALRRLDDKAAYVDAMAHMAGASALRRVVMAAREVASGRWWRYTPRTFR